MGRRSRNDRATNQSMRRRSRDDRGRFRKLRPEVPEVNTDLLLHGADPEVTTPRWWCVFLEVINRISKERGHDLCYLEMASAMLPGDQYLALFQTLNTIADARRKLASSETQPLPETAIHRYENESPTHVITPETGDLSNKRKRDVDPWTGPQKRLCPTGLGLETISPVPPCHLSRPNSSHHAPLRMRSR